MPESIVSRRSFLGWSAGVSAAAAFSRTVKAEEAVTLGGEPTITIDRPRATSGDRAVEPKWDEKLTITVGPKDADIVGTSHQALQAAVNYVAELGGGT